MTYFTCKDMQVLWYQSMCIARVLLNVFSKIYFETICCEHLRIDFKTLRQVVIISMVS